MVSTTWPDGTPKSVDDNEYEVFGSAWSGDGVIGLPSDTSPVFGDSSGRVVKFRSGKRALVHGHGWASGISDITVAVTANGAGQPRVDLAVLGLDRTTWLVTEYVKAGTPAVSPTPPTLQRDALGVAPGKWEIPLATINVAAGATGINAADVTSVAAFLGPQQGLYVADATALAQLPAPGSGQLAYVASAASAGNPVYHYVGGVWRRLDWNTSWGIIGGKRYPGTDPLAYLSGVSLADTGISTGSVSLLNGRRYTVEMSFPIGYNVSASDVVTYSVFSAVKATGGTTVGQASLPPSQVYQAWTWQRGFDYQPTGDETVDFKLFGYVAKVSGGTLYSAFLARSSNTFWRVRDCGPASTVTTA